MYCPICFNQTLRLNPNGVVEIIIDGKQMDAGRFLFRVDMKGHELIKALDSKIEEFMKWYSNFHNKKPLENIGIVTSGVTCTNSCRIPLNFNYNIINEVIPQEKVMQILQKHSEKYKVELSPSLQLKL